MPQKTARFLRHAHAAPKALAKNARHQFAAAHALLVFRTGAIYSLIPKNGCTSVRYSLAVANGCIRGPDQFHWVHENNATFQADLREIACAPFTFVVLRHPLERLASVYLDKIVSREEAFWTIFDVQERQGEPDDLTFRKFVEILKSPLVLNSDIHWRPQADFLVYEEYDAYIALDGLTKAAPMLAERAGLDLLDARQLSRHGNDHYQTVEEGCHADLSPYDIRALRKEGKTIRHSDLYDDSLRRLAKDIYAGDIKLFNEKIGMK
ncbi:MAG: sulfotransferase family 2 domain-containing protein [Pseudomonadota bacterium]